MVFVAGMPAAVATAMRVFFFLTLLGTKGYVVVVVFFFFNRRPWKLPMVG
jgi:hypothetical protein